MPKFEAHITCHNDQASTVEEFASAGWKFSRIDGDALMGPKPYCYLTAYDTDADKLYMRTKAMAYDLTEAGGQVLREKIERIVYDTKTGVDELIERIQT